MNIHAIVDYSYIYYKYKFQVDGGRMKRLSTVYDNGIMAIDKDISNIYYSIREIEGFRRTLEKYGHNVTMSICFDSPSCRQDVLDGATEHEIKAAELYKANRVKVLKDEDFDNMRLVAELMDGAGHNIYKMDGFEADDLISNLVDNYKDIFDYNVIYTTDADLLVNISNNVGAQRYKTRVGYTAVELSNFEEYLSKEFKCSVPYNSLMLFKSTVGDSSDNIKGIRRFGPKAFDKLVDYLSGKGIDWSEYGTYNKTLDLLNSCEGYLKADQIEQAIGSLYLVRPLVIEERDLIVPDKVSDSGLREESYMKLNMKSLIE